MRTAEQPTERPEMAAMVAVQNPRGYDGTYWYTAHESQVTDNLVVDFNRVNDVFDNLYHPVMYAELRRARIRHIELASEPFNGRTRMLGRPVDAEDWPLEGTKHHPLGWVDLRLVGYGRSKATHPWCSPWYIDFVMPTLDIRENWHRRLWVRFVYPPDWDSPVTTI